jgi:hypothetical protein
LGILAFSFVPGAAAESAPITISPELSGKLAQTTQGARLNVGDLDLSSFPLLPTQITPKGHQYIFSDNPEYIRVPEGAAIRELAAPGKLRLYTYHVNGTTATTSKITTVIENLGNEPLTVRYLRRGNAGPSTNYYLVGKRAMRRFLESTPDPEPSLTVPVKGAAVLDPYKEAARVGFDELLHSFHDLEINQPARIIVLQTPPENDSVEVARRIEETLPPKAFGAGRGVFPHSDYDVKVHGTDGPDSPYDTAHGPRQVIVADGKHDPWLEGIDSELGTTVALKGNYGMIYDMEIPVKTSDGRSLAVAVYNARTGAKWCDNMAAVIGVSGGVFPEGLVDVPADFTYVTGLDTVVVLQIVPPSPEVQTLRVTFTPPGASCLPVPILLIPFDTPTQN